ncbi:MAG: hypothetical protein EOP24_19045 [Hyphomicrobiales bacterium]|nr:MAG: hypothetical protein EOP24_19045 [Hyphomicrobiales bacterium]
MCTRYIPPDVAEIEREWHIGRHNQPDWTRDLHPLYAGPYIRANEGGGHALVVGQWGMIPHDSDTRVPMSRPRGPGEKPKRISTVNARTETVNSRPTYSGPWRRGQRCIVPAESFFEPNWESGKNVWWRFRRADGRPWGVAGLWSMWTDPATGEIVPNYTMLTINANAHPVMSRMHRPEVDSKTKQPLPLDRQDKRSLVLLEADDFDRWLTGSAEDAKALFKLTPAELFDAAPMPPAQ